MSGPVEQALARSPYARAMVEKQTLPDRQKALRIWPVDGTEILHEDGTTVRCWNALSPSQQRRLIEGHHGPAVRNYNGARCQLPATVLLEQLGDEGPGPRFYCLGCAARHLAMQVVTV